MRDAASSSGGGATDGYHTKERCHSVTAQYHEFSNDDSESSNDDSDFELQHVPPKQQTTRRDPVVAVNNEMSRKNRRMPPNDASGHTRSHTTTIVAKRGRGRPRKPQSLKSLKKALSSSSGGPVWTEVSAVSHVFCDEIQTYLLTTKSNLSGGQVECLERVSQAVETRLEQHNEIVIENIKVAREASASQRQVKHLRDDLLVCTLRLKKYREEHFALQQSSQQQQTATRTALRASRFLTALQNLASSSHRH
eukprot:scaffold7608_cov67-Attheya_sp.AAC.7